MNDYLLNKFSRFTYFTKSEYIQRMLIKFYIIKFVAINFV